MKKEIDSISTIPYTPNFPKEKSIHFLYILALLENDYYRVNSTMMLDSRLLITLLIYTILA